MKTISVPTLQRLTITMKGQLTQSVTISPKVRGESYTLKSIGGFNFTLQYDKASGKLTFRFTKYKFGFFIVLLLCVRGRCGRLRPHRIKSAITPTQRIDKCDGQTATLSLFTSRIKQARKLHH